MSFNAFNRRQALSLMAATATLPLMPSLAQAQDGGVRAIVLSDLHSAYERLAQVLAAVEAEIAGNEGAEHIILINGDIFEMGNVAAMRSGGQADWAFLEMLAGLAPTVVNIGNHEPDFDNDLANFVGRAEELGVHVLSNIVDTRTGEAYAPANVVISTGTHAINVVAIATDAINTYPKPTREQLTIPAPVTWAEENLPDLLEGGGINVVLSHAGVVADKAILPLLGGNTLLVGGHDHLRFVHEEGSNRYVHTGSWSSLMSVVSLAEGAVPEVAQVDIARDGAGNEALAEVIAAVLAEHLTDEERASVGTSPATMTLGQTGRFVAQTIADAAGADFGFIGHTSLGTGFANGDVSLFDYNAVVRFEGKIVTAEVSGAELREIFARVNQDGDSLTLDRRTGDFLYAAPEATIGEGTYTIAANDWSGINQKAYFGREDLVFAEVPGLLLKSVVRDTLN